MFENRDIASHPRVHVAFDWDSNLFAREGQVEWNSGRLDHIRFPVVGGHGMNVVRGGVTVHHIELLIRLYSDHMRPIRATLLFKDGGLCRRLKGPTFETVSDEYDNIFQA